jgi:hypothetical protein
LHFPLKDYVQFRRKLFFSQHEVNSENSDIDCRAPAGGFFAARYQMDLEHGKFKCFIRHFPARIIARFSD